MRMRLQQLRSQSTDLEKLRDDVIKSLKTIHQRITVRRKEGSMLFFLFHFDFCFSFSSRHLEEKILSREEENASVGRTKSIVEN